MIILDTTVWIEFLKNNQNFYPQIKELLEKREILAVECVFGELLQGIKNKSEQEIINSFWRHLPKVNYEKIILEAGEYSSKNMLIDQGVGLLDSIILVHAIKGNSRIWTLDKKFLRVIPIELRYKECPNID